MILIYSSKIDNDNPGQQCVGDREYLTQARPVPVKIRQLSAVNGKFLHKVDIEAYPDAPKNEVEPLSHMVIWSI